MLWVSMLILPFLGFGLMQQMAPSNTILQTIVDDEKRGRVMSFYSMAFLGMSPFGSLLAGSLAARIGAPHTVMVNGAMCLLASLLFSRKLPEIRKIVRPIYVRLGIVSEELVAER
jgi:MFS family permease